MYNKYEQQIGIRIENLDSDGFLKVRETLTRFGIMSDRDPDTKKRTLSQTAYILHSDNKYYIAHFKELFVLDNIIAEVSREDIERRNYIIKELESYGLIKVLDKNEFNKVPAKQLNIIRIRHKDKQRYILKPKFSFKIKLGRDKD